MREENAVLSEQEKALIRELQGDILLGRTPFARIGKKIGFSEEEIFARIRRWQEEGLIRRFGAILRHYRAGIASNVMIVWKVPKDRTEETGKVMASFPQVSHCYERPVFPRWPYNLFTMVHGTSKEECQHIAGEIAGKTGIEDYQLLYSSKEYKKSSMKYFAE